MEAGNFTCLLELTYVNPGAEEAKLKGQGPGFNFSVHKPPSQSK